MVQGRQNPMVLVARTRDEELLSASSSGGIFSVLARAVIRRGGMVIGAAFGEKASEVKHIAVHDEEGLAKLRGAKYARSDIGEVISEKWKAEGDGGMPVLFSGTPCQVAAMRERAKGVGALDDNFLFVEVVCHGVPRQDVVDAYLKDIEAINYRDKSTGWKSYSISGKRFTSPWWQNPFMKGYVANLFLEDGCTRCPFKDGKSGADITLGDYWNAEERFPTFADDRGASLVVLRTERGRKAWAEIAAEVMAETSDMEHAVAGNPALVRGFAPHPKAAQFLADMRRGVAFERAVDRALRPWWRRLGTRVKRMLGAV